MGLAIGPNCKHIINKIYHEHIQQSQHISCVSMPYFLSKAAPGFLSKTVTLGGVTDNGSMWMSIGRIRQCVLQWHKNQFTKRFMSWWLKLMFALIMNLMIQPGNNVSRLKAAEQSWHVTNCDLSRSLFYIRFVLFRNIWTIRSIPFCKVERWPPDSEENWDKRTKSPRFSIASIHF